MEKSEKACLKPSIFLVIAETHVFCGAFTRLAQNQLGHDVPPATGFSCIQTIVLGPTCPKRRLVHNCQDFHPSLILKQH